MERALLTDKDWSSIDGQVCLVLEFSPMAKMESGEVIAIPKLPYASVQLRTEDATEIKGFISHRTDFAMLWAAFNERTNVPGVRTEVSNRIRSPEDLSLDGLRENEEVWLVWRRNNYSRLAFLMKPILPRLTVMVCRKGARDLLMDNNLRPELNGEARAIAIHPLVTWTPEVMAR